MPRTGSGQFVLPPSNPVQADTIIETGWANPTLTDIANALSTSIATDGQTTPTANLPMGGFRHTNVGPALAANQYARADQVQGFVFNIVTNVQNDSGRVTFTGTTPFSIGNGTVNIPNLMPLLFVPSANNGGPSTLALNGGPTHPILNSDATPLFADQITAGRPYALVYNGANWILITNTLDLSILNTQFLRLSGGTMLGALTLSQAPSTDLMAATKKYVDDSIAGSVAGVASFNTRTGAVTLLSSDVTTALSYTPFNAAGGTIGGNVLVNGGITGGGFLADRYKVNIVRNDSASGTINLQPVSVSTNYILGLLGNITITIEAGMLVGNIFRVTVYNTTGRTITWPGGVIWPMPTQTPPAIDTGITKNAIFVLMYLGGTQYLANASVY